MIGHRRTAVFLMALLALVGGFITGRDLWFNLAYLLGLLLIISFVWAWININWLRLSRLTRTRRTQVGRPLEERFEVQNTSIVPKLWLEVQDFSELPDHYASRVINNLSGRGRYSWRTTTICKQRGRYQLGPIRLHTSDPFGLFPMTRDLEETSHVVVFPMTFDIHRFVLPVGLLSGGDALRRRTHHVTTNASGVRDYVPGDSFGRIHWPSTARRNRLIVKEFELDPLADIWIVPDMASFSHLVSPEVQKKQRDDLPEWMVMEKFKLAETTEEYTVTAAASLAQFFLRQDRAVGMMAYGQSNEILQPDRSERQLNRVLETLAVLRAQGQVPLSNVIQAEMHLFPRGATVICITPQTDQNWATVAKEMERRGLRIVTILVNPASFGGTLSNDPLLILLQANNLIAYQINAGDDFSAVFSSTKTPASQFAYS
ncbi:MAG: DUF58 domain-containing protein [Candidatus Promineifilaceae bacterium]|jgi:uncharacterized protein (DUF58 family)